MSIQIRIFGKRVVLLAEKEGLEFRSTDASVDWARPESWPLDSVGDAAGRRTSFEVASLLEMGLGTQLGASVVVPSDCFAALIREEFQLTTAFTQPNPFLLKIEKTGDMGHPDFRYRYQFILAGEVIPLKREGYYLSRAATGAVYHLDEDQFRLVEAMDRFNVLPAEQKGPEASWLIFADVKRLSRELNVTLDAWLRSNDVVVPSSIGLDLYEDESGALSFMPSCPELDKEAFRTVFDRNKQAEGFYSIDKPGLGRVRVVLPPKQRAVLERMKRVRKVTGETKQRLLADPLQPFDGIAGDVELPLLYGDRVTGIGEFEFAPVPKPISEESGMSGLWNSGASATKDKPPVDQKDESSEPKGGKKTLLIDTHEESVRDAYTRQSEEARRNAAITAYQCPVSLKPGVNLKRHQETGVNWLQLCSRVPGRAGVLLADDMGVGKTLQIITFLAWSIESGLYPELSRPAPPFRPILIVAPLILLETQTWEREMEHFFSDQGVVFWPVLPLYGGALQSYRRNDLAGSEGLLARPVLDIDRIRRNRVVITNYEAIRDYEFSFAYQPEGKPLWSVVVADEAQEFKTPNSRISHAVKKLQPEFRIACTGTPVENRLLDLWNIFDAVQPGLLGSARDFSERFEKQEPNAKQDPLANLKSRLLYQQPNAFLLRRSKEEVLELPAKKEHKLPCTMSTEEIQAHLRLARGLGDAGAPKRKVNLLGDFARLYQHRLLVGDSGDEFSVAQLKSASSKLTAVVGELRRIRGLREKAIIFARHKDVQRMLARVLSAEFGLSVRILNGDTPKSSSRSKTGAESRSQLLRDFRSREGFDVIILSPFVAGVGLTIVEANHVIHYGRWWNPAVEAQATDRAYRLGQEREVHVYFPILEDPSGTISRTFDQVLDDLMERKKALAINALNKDSFFAPKESEETLGAEVAEVLASSSVDFPA
jgi:superfamily II DNA or RNA helicase